MLNYLCQVKEEVKRWIRDYFEKNGKGCFAVIGISGGKDSSVAATLCAEALGKDRVVGVLMPNGIQSDIEDAKRLVEFLEIPHLIINIGATSAALCQIGLFCPLRRKNLKNFSKHFRFTLLRCVPVM